MRLHRFYVNKPLGEELVVESASEKELIHQWTSVFRYTNGDSVVLFSPHSLGKDFIYSITEASKHEVRLTLSGAQDNILPNKPIILVMALVKKDTFETVVRQATELGVTAVIPLLASRSEKKNLNFERLSAIAIEASEQCGRGTVPSISDIVTFEEALAQTKDGYSIVGSLEGQNLSSLSSLPNVHSEKTTYVWIGPEGGWTLEEEKSFEEQGFHKLLCGQTVLKADTAAVSMLSLVSSFPLQSSS